MSVQQQDISEEALGMSGPMSLGRTGMGELGESVRKGRWSCGYYQPWCDGM